MKMEKGIKKERIGTRNKMAEHKDKKIVFSEEIDSSINGFALGIANLKK